MRFAEPDLLWLLWLVPLAAVWLAFGRRARRRLLARIGDPRLVNRLTEEASPRREAVKDFLVAAALGCLVLTLARPQFGEKEVRVVRKGIDVMIALDTSLSMLAEDFKPNRLEAAKRSVRTLIDRLEGDRVGLISFAGRSFVQCPLTLDYGACLIFLNDIGVDTIPRPGTALGEAVDRAREAFDRDETQYKALVIFSDGEDHGTEPAAAARRAAREGVRVYAVGMGTLEGAPIPLYDDQGRLRGHKKDKQDRPVVTRLAEETLREAALASGGAYFRATRRGDEIEHLYQEISRLEKKELEDRLMQNYEDRFQWPAGAALLLMTAEFFIGRRRKAGRP